MLAIVILAAGQSSRMRGRDKLLEKINGRPLLRQITQRALETGVPTFVALPKGGGPRSAVLPLGAQVISVTTPDLGMGVSIATAIAHLSCATTSAMILPADMPEITTDDLTQVIAAQAKNPDRILRAVSGDTAGHPVVFPRRWFGDLKRLAADHGAKDILKKHAKDVITVPLPAKHAITDLDTPEDWSTWRAQQSQSEV